MTSNNKANAQDNNDKYTTNVFQLNPHWPCLWNSSHTLSPHCRLSSQLRQGLQTSAHFKAIWRKIGMTGLNKSFPLGNSKVDSLCTCRIKCLCEASRRSKSWLSRCSLKVSRNSFCLQMSVARMSEPNCCSITRLQRLKTKKPQIYLKLWSLCLLRSARLCGFLRDLSWQVGQQSWFSQHAHSGSPVVALQHRCVLDVQHQECI